MATARSCRTGGRCLTCRADPHWRDGADHLLAYVGMIGEQDNVDNLVDAVAALSDPPRAQGRRGGVWIRARLSARASEGRDVADAFEWLGFVRDRERIAGLVRAADVCIAPEIDSKFNRLASFVKIVEYMSAGAAIVAHRLPQTEALAGDTIGYAPEMTATGLAATIRDMLDAPARRRALGAAARERFCERLSWERNGAPRLVSGYERLLGGGAVRVAVGARAAR